MKPQSKRTRQLRKQFPGIDNALPRNWTKSKEVEMRIRVQRADLNSMHLKPDNITSSNRSYVMHEDGYRGQRYQFFAVVDKEGNVIRRLYQFRDGEGLMSKDIFAEIGPTEVKEVEYALWITQHRWHEAPDDESQSLFGKLVKSDIDVIVFRRPKPMSWLELIKLADDLKHEREDARNHPPDDRPQLVGIYQALEDGCKMHAFLSGGGLRVIRLEHKETLKGYGEHPDVVEALVYAGEDYVAGGRPYDEVYGKIYPHYLTGQSLPASNIDAWIRMGRSFDVWQEGKEIVFQLNGYHDTTAPESVATRARAGERVRWVERGFVFESYPYVFANSEVGYGTEVISKPEGKAHNDAFFFRITKTGRSLDLWEAMAAAFDAEEVEVER